MMQAEPRVVMCSIWRNDADRDLDNRAQYLLGKSYPELRWVWLVGDSQDDTFSRLASWAARERRVTLAQYDTGLLGEEMMTRLDRLSMMVDELLRRLRIDDNYVLIHESDLFSPVDVVERMIAHAAAGRTCIAGWPTIALARQPQFYDIWAYRAGGVCFEAWPPYHAVYRAREPFEVDSFGSVYMFPAREVRGGIPRLRTAALGICEHLRSRGLHLWVDPTLRIEQPVALWRARQLT